LVGAINILATGQAVSSNACGWLSLRMVECIRSADESGTRRSKQGAFGLGICRNPLTSVREDVKNLLWYPLGVQMKTLFNLANSLTLESNLNIRKLKSIEICAGAGGQALGLEQAGFNHVALVEIDVNACNTLQTNRSSWNVINTDVKTFSGKSYFGIDLLAGGVPCPPFSIAGKQLGKDDERDLFPEALRIIHECEPNAVMLENVRGLFAPKFANYRATIKAELERLGYVCKWELVQAHHYGVSQLRPRTLLIALKSKYAQNFFLHTELPLHLQRLENCYTMKWQVKDGSEQKTGQNKLMVLHQRLSAGAKIMVVLI
jgi:predicted RNA methylase